MRLEWIDDLLSVLDEGSLAKAADKRLLTQSAFTRRVRTIEASIGAPLFDRTRKPVSLLPGVVALEPELREISSRLRRLRYELKTSADASGKPLAFICQHALTTTISAQIVRTLRTAGDGSVQVRSGNQDECLMQLLSREVDFAIMYAIPGEKSAEENTAFEVVTLGSDELIPVCTPSLRADASRKVLPVIAYPSEVFLGQVFARLISPRLAADTTAIPIAETSLTLAMQQLARSDIGIAWLPLSLVAADLAQGHLVRVDDTLPSQLLTIRMIRRQDHYSDQSNALWDACLTAVPLGQM